MNPNRRLSSRLAASCVIASVLPVRAQSSTTRIFVGFPAGGLPDRVARAIAPSLQSASGRPAVVENLPGANGRLAGQALKKAAADGSAYLVAPASNIVHLPHVHDLGYDPFVDFVPVGQAIENDFCFAVSGKLPCNTLAEFAAWSRDHPERSNFGSPGTGSSLHLHGLMIARMLDIKLTHVPYRGSVQGLSDLQGGHLTSVVASTVSLIPQHKSGGLKILATTARARSRVLPEVPTFAELGMGQLTLVEGTWMLARTGTPEDLIDRASRAVVDSVRSKEMQVLLDDHTVAAPLSAAELRQYMRSEFDRRGALIRSMRFTSTS